MLTIWDSHGAKLASRGDISTIGDETIWIDLLNPTPEEDKHVEGLLGLSVPTRAEMREIEASNRLYKENGAHYMTAYLVFNIDQARPDSGTVTFILAGNRLVTVRYSDPKPFSTYRARTEKGEATPRSGASVMIGLIEAIVQNEADLIERIQDEVDRLALSIFDIKGGNATRNRRLDVILRGTGREGDIVSRAQESATSLDRVLHFLGQAARERGDDSDIRARIEAAHKDINSLTEHMHFLAGRTSFLLDATLGMITTEQNQIIKLFSVMAVMLMPPTLVASIYGMNFKHMPELEWPLGYPMALGLMALSALVPFIYFRRKGWL